jgi:ABC-type amino acid transport substrate-binding protein
MASTAVEAQESDILGSLDAEASAVQTSAAVAITQELEANPEAPMSVQEEPVWNRIMGREKMVVGVKADAPPFGVLRDDGQFWGFEVDLAMALGQHMGVEVELVPVSAKQRAPYILQDKVDLVMATMTMTQKREQVVDFSIPYFEVGQGLITHADATIGSFEDLKGKKVAVLEGTQAFHTLRRIQPDCYLVIVDSYGNGIDQVLNKDVDAICSDHLLLMGLLHDHPGMALLTLVEETFAPDPYAIAMRENESTLRDTVNEALMQFWEEGIWQDTYETWFGMGSMYNHDLVFRINMLPK